MNSPHRASAAPADPAERPAQTPHDVGVPDDTTDRLSDLFVRTAKRIRRRTSHHLAPLGLTPAQSRALRVAGHAARPLRMADLAERLDIVPRSATTVVDDLQAAGLVRRRADHRDRRSTLVELTAAGRRCLESMLTARRAAAHEAFSRLRPDEREQLLHLLVRLEQTAEADQPVTGDRTEPPPPGECDGSARTR